MIRRGGSSEGQGQGRNRRAMREALAAQAVLEACERGEDVAKRNYEKALGEDLPANIRSIVQRQYEGVVENHDLVRDLRV